MGTVTRIAAATATVPCRPTAASKAPYAPASPPPSRSARAALFPLGCIASTIAPRMLCRARAHAQRGRT
jgi:hypothetical protein